MSSVWKKYREARWRELFASGEGLRPGTMRILWCSFLAFLWLPLAAQLTRFPPTTGLAENRTPAPVPNFNPYDPRAFTAGFERWYGDSFGLRPFLVFGNNWIVARLFRTSPNVEVQFGSDGWFFFTADKSTENARGLVPFTNAELESIVRRLEDQHARMKASGIPYVVLVCPNKQSIYPELLPSWMTTLGPTRLDQVKAAVGQRKNLSFVDPRTVLLDAKRRGPVYMRTDSHWNAWGALVGHAALLKRLREDFPAIAAWNPDRWHMQVVRGGGGGDLTSTLLGLPGAFSDDWVSVVPPDSEPPKRSALKVIVFHDSFITQWRPFLDAAFDKVILQHRGVRGLDDEFVDREKPDLVIYEVVERNIDVFLHPSLR